MEYEYKFATMMVKGMKVGAAAAEITADRSMVIGGSIHPRFAPEQEGRLRASAIIVEKDVKVGVVSCDVLMLQRDLLDEVCREIEAELGIPFDNILIAATHTHHAPTTATVHGYQRDETFCENVKYAILSAMRVAEKKLKDAEKAEMLFWLGNESTVGQNSRLLLRDGTISWGGPPEEALRPTGPTDPELPIMAFKTKDGGLEALFFNHSTHNIGTRHPNIRSPGFYVLAAQELEEEIGGTVLFLPGAFGSTHNLTLSADEMIRRIEKAVKEALSESKPRAIPRVVSVKQEFEYRVRKFDEKKEDEAVSYYCNRWKRNPEPIIEVFRRMRKELSEHQGEMRKSWLQVMLLGDVALVGAPGELFTELGIQIKRRSPFRYTYVVGLANDWIGYIPDKEAFNLGGYQVWTGFHSFVEKGTGEALVEKAVQLLSDLYSRQ